MNQTKLISNYFFFRRKDISRYDTHAEELQMKVLRRLTQKARHTEGGIPSILHT